MRAYAVVAIGALKLATACANDVQERPATPARGAPPPSTFPLPDTVFRGDRSEAEPPPPNARDRFTTRRIGADTAERSRYHGAPVDLDLKGADVHDVFRLLADVGKVNVVVGSEVSGTLTMRLRHVPWDQAMDVIARVRGLVYERDGNVILVRTASAK
jgi:type IV pilus assembly protein PilQ